LTLPGDGEATVRLLRPTDTAALTTLFESLSPETRRRYGPHPFDRATAERLCASLDPRVTMRFVAELPDGALVAYMILTRVISDADLAYYDGFLLPEPRRAELAPVVVDAYQDRGLGSRMARHVLATAHQVGIEQVILMGGVQAINDRAYHFYRKLGFQPIGAFWTGQGDDRLFNYAMILNTNR
jgi:GNAT superfamily N-acetyltransferase